VASVRDDLDMSRCFFLSAVGFQWVTEFVRAKPAFSLHSGRHRIARRPSSIAPKPLAASRTFNA
jgi:hypothetical protein